MLLSSNITLIPLVVTSSDLSTVVACEKVSMDLCWRTNKHKQVRDSVLFCNRVCTRNERDTQLHSLAKRKIVLFIQPKKL